jgi:myo-inositol-1(or 4)-monophosphatase
MAIGTKRDAHDIVTAHDRASEAAIAARIRAAVPGSTVVGEEGGRQGEGRVVWYVDPIDGTTNFARGLPGWCVSIAAEVDGAIVAGVVHVPVTGETFRADLSGAWLHDTPLVAAARPREAEAVMLTSFPAARHYDELGDADAAAAHRALADAFLALRDPGTGALQLAWVAAGWADATLGFMTNPWDVAAGALILARAGGSFVALSGGETVREAARADDYYGVGAGADYPTLDRVARAVSRRLPARDALEAAHA